MGLIKPLLADFEAVQTGGRPAKRWVAVSNEPCPLAYPTRLTVGDRRGEVCWWVETEEVPFR